MLNRASAANMLIMLTGTCGTRNVRKLLLLDIVLICGGFRFDDIFFDNVWLLNIVFFCRRKCAICELTDE